jgi:hypothetical protein
MKENYLRQHYHKPACRHKKHFGSNNIEVHLDQQTYQCRTYITKIKNYNMYNSGRIWSYDFNFPFFLDGKVFIGFPLSE